MRRVTERISSAASYSMADKVTEPEVEQAYEDQPKAVSSFTRWYRSPLFNVIVVGLISFTQPGIWNALNSKLCR